MASSDISGAFPYHYFTVDGKSIVSKTSEDNSSIIVCIMTLSDEKRKALRGELFLAFVPELLAERHRCSNACRRLNDAGDVSRRRLVELWRE